MLVPSFQICWLSLQRGPRSQALKNIKTQFLLPLKATERLGHSLDHLSRIWSSYLWHFDSFESACAWRRHLVIFWEIARRRALFRNQIPPTRVTSSSPPSSITHTFPVLHHSSNSVSSTFHFILLQLSLTTSLLYFLYKCIICKNQTFN